MEGRDLLRGLRGSAPLYRGLVPPLPAHGTHHSPARLPRVRPAVLRSLRHAVRLHCQASAQIILEKGGPGSVYGDNKVAKVRACMRHSLPSAWWARACPRCGTIDASLGASHTFTAVPSVS